jgi:hypothetical protein
MLEPVAQAIGDLKHIWLHQWLEVLSFSSIFG